MEKQVYKYETKNKVGEIMKYFKKLVGDSIYLSPRNSEDIEIFTKWLNDFQVTDGLGRSGLMVTLNGEKEYLEKIHDNDNKNYYFVIVTLENDEMIGTISLENMNYINRSAELGIFIGDETYRGKGIGKEAIHLMLDYGFNYLNLNSIQLTVLTFNERAIACYKKCGFKEVGKLREAYYLNGKYYDKILMDILRSEFNETYIRNKYIK